MGDRPTRTAEVQARIEDAFRRLPPSRDATARFTAYTRDERAALLITSFVALGGETLDQIDAVLDRFDSLIGSSDSELLAHALKQYLIHHANLGALGLSLPPLERRAPHKVGPRQP